MNNYTIGADGLHDSKPIVFKDNAVVSPVRNEEDFMEQVLKIKSYYDNPRPKLRYKSDLYCSFMMILNSL